MPYRSPHDECRRLLESHAELSLGVIGRLAGMIRKLTDAAQELALQSAYRRPSV